IVPVDDDGMTHDGMFMKTAQGNAHGLLLLHIVAAREGGHQVIELQAQRLERDDRHPLTRAGHWRIALVLVLAYMKEIDTQLAIAIVAHAFRRRAGDSYGER